MIIKRVDPISVAKIAGFIYAVLGLIFGCVIALIGTMGSGVFGSMFGFGAVTMIVVMPILYGIVGFIAMLIASLVYNFAAGMVGGIQIETE